MMPQAMLGPAVVLVSLICMTPSHLWSTLQRRPIVIAAEAPTYPALAREIGIQGLVRIRVSTDGMVVSGTQVVIGHPMLAFEAVVNLRSWRFERHDPTTFETTYRFGFLSGTRQCLSGNNVTIASHVPEEIEVSAPPRLIGRYTPDLPVIETSRLVGIVRCECTTAEPVVNAEIVVRDRDPALRLTTDGDGRFDVPELPPGQYRVVIRAKGFEDRVYRVRVRKDVSAVPIEMSMFKDPCPALLVEQAAIPFYPALAKRARIEGEVRLRLGSGGPIVVSGDRLLAEAASANLRTWRVVRRSNEATEVVYQFILHSADCRTDNEPYTLLRFPDQVRIVACDPRDRAGGIDDGDRPELR